MRPGSAKAWLIASRPKTLPAAIVPVWAGCLMAWDLDRRFDLRLAALTCLGAIFIQIATNFFNDVIDAKKGADTVARRGPKRVTVTGLLSSRKVYGGALVMLLSASICGAYLFQERGWAIVVIGIPSLYLSYGYTGGFFPLAYKGVGEIFVILFFGLVAVMGTIFIQTESWRMEGFLLGLQVGFLSAVLIAVNNYRDVEDDQLAHKMTLAVRLGRPVVKWMIFVMTVTPSLLVLVLGGPITWFLISFPMATVFLILEIRFLKSAGVSSALLGLSALHLILFVFAQNLAMALTW